MSEPKTCLHCAILSVIYERYPEVDEAKMADIIDSLAKALGDMTSLISEHSFGNALAAVVKYRADALDEAAEEEDEAMVPDPDMKVAH